METYLSHGAQSVLGFPDAASWTHTVGEEKRQRRSVFIFLIGLLTFIAAAFETSLLGAEGWTLLNVAILILFTLLFAHVAIGFCQGFLGFLVLSETRKTDSSPNEQRTQNFSILPVTAIVVPIYNEEVPPVFARLRVMHDELCSLGALDRFEFFILSDSTDPEKALAEQVAWARVVAATGSAGRIHYRRRTLPLNRKSGNIADFCRRWGAQYRYMICLDADSLMSATTLVELVRRMENNPRIGILQTVPQAINGLTIWSRLQQFSMALYGPIFAAGANFWHQEESNFWGHNAIVRLAPFMQHCVLPKLPAGARPMSHDFVEAALMRRAGWEVHLAHDLSGSYEETPPTVIEHLKRDRRWCQGNLQHWPLALAPGFKPMTRFHFLHGIFSFLASPLLLLLLLLGFWKNLASSANSSGIFAGAARVEAALVLFGFTMLLLLLPKLLALAAALWNGHAKEFGGAAKMVFSVCAEIAFSVLIAPVFLFFHAKFVLFNLLGKKVEWHAQRRECDAGYAWREAANVFCLTTGLGIVAAVVIWWFTPGYFFWLLPILIGWLLAIPLTALSGDLRIGILARKAGLFLVPSEVAPPTEVSALRREQGGRAPFSESTASLLAAIDPIAQRLLPGLTNKGTVHLHRQIWTTPAEHLPPPWRFQMQVAASG